MTTTDSLPELKLTPERTAIPVTAAENLLLEKVKTGEWATVSEERDVSNPNAWTTEQTIRGPFLRHLCLHPDRYKVDAKGFYIQGALIAGPLDFHNAKLTRFLGFLHVRFASTPLLCDAYCQTLNLTHCHLPGLTADGLQVAGNLFLRESLLLGETSLIGADINGVLECNNARFENSYKFAFNAHSLKTKGTVFLNKARVKGETILMGADIGGNLECTNALLSNPGTSAFTADRLKTKGDVFLRASRINGETSLMGADIGGSLDCSNAHFENPGKNVFLAEHLTVKELFFWTEFATPPQGNIHLTHTSVGGFIDDGSGWPVPGGLLIEGFRYEHLVLPTSATERCKWLSKMPETWNDQPVFWSQPYEQLIKVFRNAGQDRDARRVSIAKNDAYRSYLKRKKGPLLERFSLWAQKYSFGYGYFPYLPLFSSFAIITLGSIIFETGQIQGAVLPAKDRVYTSSCFKSPDVKTNVICDGTWRTYSTARRYVSHLDPSWRPDWFTNTVEYNLPTAYVTFHAAAYSVDVFVPVLNLQQEDSWMPKSGWFRFYMWIHILFGWVLTTFSVIGFTEWIKTEWIKKD